MANKYWVPSGNGLVSSITNWSDTSGGASGAVKPGPADAVIVNSLSGTGVITFDEATTYASFSVTGRAIYDKITNSGGSSLTVSGLMTLTGANASTQRLWVVSGTIGTAFAISAGSVALTNVDFEEINATGAAFTGTSIGNCGGNTNITQTTPISCYWNDDATATHVITDALWFTTSGGAVAARFPLPQDTGYFDALSFSATGRTITTTVTGQDLRLPTLIWTGATNNPTFFNGTIRLYGTLTLIEDMTFTVNSAAYFLGRGSHTLTSADHTFAGVVVVRSATGTLTLQDDFESDQFFYVWSGGFNANGHDVTCANFDSFTITTARTVIRGSGTWILTGTGTVWAVSATGLTFSGASSTTKITDASATAKTFAGAGLTYGTIWLTGSGTGTFDITGSNAFAAFLVDTNPHTVRFANGSVTSVASFPGNGTPSNLITLTSISGTFTLVKTGGGTVSAYFLSVSNSVASPADTWYAAASTDGGGNTGWLFEYPSGLSATRSLLMFNSRILNLTLLGYRLQPDPERVATRGQSASGKVETLTVRVDERVSIAFRNFRKASAADATLKRNIKQWLQWAQKGNSWSFALDGDNAALTTLGAAAVAGATTLTLDSVAGIFEGDQYIVRNSTDSEIVKVITVGAGTVALAEGLLFDYAVGDRFRSENYWHGRLLESSNPIVERPPLFWDLELDFVEDANSL